MSLHCRNRLEVLTDVRPQPASIADPRGNRGSDRLATRDHSLFPTFLGPVCSWETNWRTQLVLSQSLDRIDTDRPSCWQVASEQDQRRQDNASSERSHRIVQAYPIEHAAQRLACGKCD